MDKKILFIGDSFVDGFGDYLFDHEERPFGNFWIDRGFTPYFLGDSSRDAQTILDIWVKYIPYLSANDLLVIILPFFGRTRLPRNEYVKTFFNDKIPTFYNHFIGSKSYTHKENFLEIWGNEYNKEYFNKNLEVQELINGSNASILNYIEVINSLCKITQCKKIVHCWDYKKFDSDNIIYREEMTKLIGEWETGGQLYERTNGEQGIEGDIHWSDDMNIKFMNFLLKYFKND